MIDLSYLTEEEQEMILAVLNRDAELKKLEEQRVKQLRKTERDRNRLKYLTGEWFYETKNHRHRDRIHGSDIIRTSMRQKKPVTILELSQRWSEKPSSVYGEKKDVYIPPELLGLIEDPSTESHNERVDDVLAEAQGERQRPQIKPWENPFSSVQSQRDDARDINGVKESDQTPAEGHHEVYGEPQHSQVSNFHGSTEVAGKAIGLSAEGQTDKVTVEERRSFSKVLGWFGRGSRDGKLKESLVKKEMDEKEPKDHESPEAKSEDSVPSVLQPKTKPPPNTRRGLFSLFSRAEKKDTIHEVRASDQEEISQDKTESSQYKISCTLRSDDDNILPQTSVPTSKTAEIMQEKTDIPICLDPPQIETFDQGEISTGRLANLKSFWERGNKGPKILSIKRDSEVEESEPSQLNENYHEGVERRLSDSSISPSKPNPNDPNPVDVQSTSCEISPILPRRTSSGVDISATSSHEDENASSLESNRDSSSEVSSSELQTLTVKMNAKLSPSPLLKHKDKSLGNELQEESISRDISDLKKEISTFKMSPSQQEDKVSINDLKSFWEKEKSGVRVIVSSPTCRANVKDPSPQSSPTHSSIELSEPQFDIRSTSQSSPGRMSFKEAGLTQKEKMEQTEENQKSPSTVPLQDLQDIRGRVHYITQNICNFKQSISDKHSKPSPPSSPLRSLIANGEHDEPQSTDIYHPKDQAQTGTPSPLLQSKVPRRDSYPNKETRKDALSSPIRTFAIDINPANKSPVTVRVDKGQTRSCTSPEHHRKTSDGGCDVRHIMPKERKLSADSLTRFYIPLSLHYYLGVPEQADLDERKQINVQAGETFEQVSQGRMSSESSPSQHSLLESEEITFDSSGSSTPEAWSISHTSSYWDSEDDSPVKAALERANARPISISKSLEDLASTPLQERWKTDPRSDVGLSMENVTSITKTSLSDPEQVKMMRMSNPAFMQQEMDFRNSDCASVSSFQYDKLRTCNTPSNFSICSEVASMSSVTGSVMSIYSSEFGNLEVKGTIQLAIHYVQKLGEFHIFVVQCKDLAVADVKRNRSDPYVKCYLLPDKAKYGKKKTCVRKKTLDPTYNEILRFKIPVETLKTQKLNTSVWHNDTFGRNMFLGEVELDLAEWDFNNTQMNEYLLKGRVQVPTSPKHSIGSEEMSAEIKVALRFVLQTTHCHKNKGNGELQIWVKECKNLPITRGVAIDPFVKCAVLPDTSRKSRQKTRVLKRASNPVFNHTIVYDGFRQEDLKEACVELTVWDHDRLNNHFIGGIRLGPGTGKSNGTEVNWMDSNVAEAALWERMMQSPDEWVEDILPLRLMVMARMSRS
ncbi:synaptotagmin-like protein 2 isoform X1 [Carassius auratus]|uniref:Synaptotagmin-like protein 2 n=1 Tax=Carassius auratus TaxID=7957 RepID=A0A6P6Q7I5_CARAU|nr:synaptotagmin-like protein 2 isoform X1 [Carassius auratus]